MISEWRDIVGPPGISSASLGSLTSDVAMTATVVSSSAAVSSSARAAPGALSSLRSVALLFRKKGSTYSNKSVAVLAQAVWPPVVRDIVAFLQRV